MLTTKTFNPMRGGGDHGLAPDRVARQLHESLERLEVDQVDLYLAHDFDPDVPLAETFAAFEAALAGGRIRAYGVSNFEVAQLADALAAGRPHAIQNSYSLLDRQDERELLPLCARRGVAYLAFSPLAGGWLTGKYRRGQETPPDSRAVTYPGPYMAARFDLAREGNQRKLDLVEQLEVVAKEAGLSLTHMAMAFSLAHPAVTSTIIGPRTPEQLRDLMAGADVRLDAATLDAIDALVPPGAVLNEADAGWEPPWMSTAARRIALA